MHSAIRGTGSYLPNAPVGNEELAELLDTSDEWIRTRTGISQRHYAGDITPLEMAAAASQAALRASGLSARDLDMIVVATISADMVFPSLAALLQHRLGARNVGAFDVSAACSGFIYALGIADSMIRSGRAQNVLVVGAEKMSRLLDAQDRTTCVLFGDGAGAAIVSRATAPGIRSIETFADGSVVETLNCAPALGSPFIHMSGQVVFRMAVRAMTQAVLQALRANEMNPLDIAWFIPHQANVRIIQAVVEETRLDMARTIVTLEKHGNVSGASIPIALDSAVRQGRIQSGDTVLMAAVGGGLTWGSAVLKW
jgi:3-oxoacyl-[acyl-carrier-protein] synthase-3